MEEWALRETEIFGENVMEYRQRSENCDDDYMKNYYKKTCEEYMDKLDESLQKLNDIRHQIKEYLDILKNY